MADPLRQTSLDDEPMLKNPLNSLELKVVFWNANTWKSQNCEKLLDTITSANADVICVTDARLDAYKDRYLGGYCHSLQKATGKRWRAKFEARPDRRLKCSIGGDIIFFSEKCSHVVKTAILPYGTLSAISLVWEGVNVRILSAYRPYDSKETSEGALRNASIKAVPDFEEVFWMEVCKQ